MQINAINGANFSYKNVNSRSKNANPSFGKLIPQVAKDSQSEQVKKSDLKVYKVREKFDNKSTK